MKKESDQNSNIPRGKKRDIAFIFTGLFLLFVCGYFFFTSISFLGKSVETALRENEATKNIPSFDIQGLRTLGILKTEQNTTTPLPTPTSSTQNTSSPVATSSANLP